METKITQVKYCYYSIGSTLLVEADEQTLAKILLYISQLKANSYEETNRDNNKDTNG